MSDVAELARAEEEPPRPSLGALIGKVASRVDLDVAEAELAFGDVMEGRASPIQMAALLAALRAKGEAATEVAGGVRAMRRAMVPVPVDPEVAVVDTCGTGGGDLVTFNISTTAALVAAGGGARIAKHGNRSFTSRCGTADVLEALGVRIDLTAEAMAEVFDRAGIVFMFAPILHPAMRHVIPVRRELGIPTVMNLLGPLTNPAGARRQVVGVADPAFLELVANALRHLGHEHALVVHGAPGMDELSPVGDTDVWELREGRLEHHRIRPADFGWTDLRIAELGGGDPDHNARVTLEVLDGRGGRAAHAAVVLNAGAALYVAGIAATLGDGVEGAERSIRSGAAREVLERLRKETRAAAGAAD